MTADASDHFLHYLTCDLPLGYPLKTPVAKLLTSALGGSHRRDLLHQQAEFLTLAKASLSTQPWIAYLAALKHEAVLIAIPTFAPQLVDIVDQLFFSDLQKQCKNLQEAARAAIDDATARDCERLILLQSEAAKIEDAKSNVSGAIQAGFTAVEPLPPPPEEPPTSPGSVRYFAGVAVVIVVVGFIIPPYAGGMAWALMGLIITSFIAARVLAKERAAIKAKGAEFKAYMLHENYLILCRKSIGLVLSLPLEIRKTALVNLPLCLAALRALQPEREALEAKYIPTSTKF